jgi:diguanylate cyclase (GGDEF)-like protein
MKSVTSQAIPTAAAAARVASTAALIATLVWIGLRNYLFFHALVEGFSVVVAVVTYVLASCTYRYAKDDLLLFIGQAHVVIAVLDFLHLLSYQGMGVLVCSCANTATQLWIAGRYLWGLTLLLLPLFIRRRLPRPAITAALIGLAALMAWAVFAGDVFPVCFTQENGLTPFKLASEAAIIAITATGALLLGCRRAEIDPGLYRALIFAAAATIASELCFTLYDNVYGLMNMAGHILKIVAYNSLFQGVVLKGLRAPLDSIFAELRASAVRDSLTGLYNRHGFQQAAIKEMNTASQTGGSIGALLADLDKFKRVNDTFGHQAGDEVLKTFAAILGGSVKPSDTVARLGGDEFAVLLPGAGLDEARAVAASIRDATRSWARSSSTASTLDVSIGVALWLPHMQADIDTLMREADRAMYDEKASK